MQIKELLIKRIVFIAVSFLVLAILFFTIFSFMVARTNVNVIKESANFIRQFSEGKFSESLKRISDNLQGLEDVILAESIILVLGFVVAGFAITYFFNLYTITKKDSFIDALTRVYNRKALKVILMKEIERAKRFKHPLTVIMLDIDHFKKYNDKNGHLEGDRALKKVARLIVQNVRKVDYVMRFGGEEFLIILPETPHSNAVEIAERIRKGVEKAKFKGEYKLPNKNFTVSLGLATFRGKLKSERTLIKNADDLLYKAKAEGRNKLIKKELRN